MSKKYHFTETTTGRTGADDGPSSSGPTGRVFAHKNGTDQSVTFAPEVPVLITFGTEVEDTGGDFASSALAVASGERWMLAGAATIGSTNNGEYHALDLFKDGSFYRRLISLGSWGADPITLNFYTEVDAAGSYDIRATLGTTTTRSISGASGLTYFQARRLL